MKPAAVLLGLAGSILVLAGTGCSPSEKGPPSDARQLDTPAAPGGSQPHLAAAEDRLILSWLQRADDGPTALLIAELRGAEWAVPRTIASDENMLVNWADFPSVAVGAGDRRAAQWLVRLPGEGFAYAAYSALSEDAGLSWNDAVRIHDDDSVAEHGFVSLVDEGADGFGLIWLDGSTIESKGTMSLRYRRLGPGGTGRERVLDEDVCTCCQTSAMIWQEELWVAYRDHTEGEIRDISLLRRQGDRWSDPVLVHEDGWEISGCPVNGPALAASGTSAALAWFTGAQGRPRVLVAFPDRGGGFDGPFRIDEGNPLGRVDVTYLADGSAVVSWIERRERDAAVLVRRVGVDGSIGPARVAGVAEHGRPSGFPRLARIGSTLYVAWTAPGPPSRLRLSALEF